MENPNKKNDAANFALLLVVVLCLGVVFVMLKLFELF